LCEDSCNDEHFFLLIYKRFASHVLKTLLARMWADAQLYSRPRGTVPIAAMSDRLTQKTHHLAEVISIQKFVPHPMPKGTIMISAVSGRNW